MKDYKAETDELPRYDLREPQCRRFESIIGEAVKQGRVVLLASDMVRLLNARKGMNAHTLECRLRDAIRGFSVYQYPTPNFNPATDLSTLKVRELQGQRVEIYRVDRTMQVGGVTVAATQRVLPLHSSRMGDIEKAFEMFNYNTNGGVALEIDFETDEDEVEIRRIAERFSKKGKIMRMENKQTLKFM